MKKLIVMVLFFAVVFASCRYGPEPIVYGKDPCEHCKMTIMDNKFGAEIVTAKGKVYKFDATECLVDFIKEHPERVNNPKDQIFTIDIAAPGTLIDARSAFFLKDEAFRSPMGGNLASFNAKQLAENNLQTADGKVLTWEALLQHQ